MASKPLAGTSNIPAKPPCNIAKGYGGTKRPFLMNINDRTLLRDNFTTSTWLLIGATLQTSLLLLPIRPSYALAPAVLLLCYRFIDNLLICFGLKRNPYMDGVTIGKRAAIYPSASSTEKSPASEEVCVLLLTARCNQSPLGLLGPGFRDLADHFKSLVFDLDAQAPQNGFLGASSYSNIGDRSASSDTMSVFYFRSLEDLHAFAHADAHRAAWQWWNANMKSYPCLAIGHEVYAVPRGRWENVYVNYHASNFGATSHWVTDTEGNGTWTSPLVDAGTGQLRTMKGRMGVSPTGDDNDKYGENPYAEV